MKYLKNPASPSFTPGALVKFTEAHSFGYSYGWRPINGQELAAWYASDYSKGMDDTGESKLPPRDVSIPIRRDVFYQVIRGRVSASSGYGKRSGCCELLCFLTGEKFYADRSSFTEQK